MSQECTSYYNLDFKDKKCYYSHYPVHLILFQMKDKEISGKKYRNSHIMYKNENCKTVHQTTTARTTNALVLLITFSCLSESLIAERKGSFRCEEKC